MREWKQKQEDIEQKLEMDKKGAKRMRLDGGRKLTSASLGKTLLDWIYETTERKLLQTSTKRNGLSLRRRTSIAQKDPTRLVEKIVSYILYTRRLVIKTIILPLPQYLWMKLPYGLIWWQTTLLNEQVEM